MSARVGGRLSWFVDHSTDILLILVGTVFVVIGLVLRQASLPIDGGVTVEGRIVGHVVGRESNDRRPTIEFRDRTGALHRFDSRVGGSQFDGDVGDVVEVTYDPDDPSRAERSDDPSRWLWFLVCGLGIALWIGELGLLVYRRAVAR